MPYITMQNTKSIWEKTPKSDWESLRYVLQDQYYEENDELDEYDAERMLLAVSRLKSKRVPFPNSYQELFEVLNEWA